MNGARSPSSTAAGPDQPNVVLFVMDTTRAAETVPAGPTVTPTLSRLADGGTEFTRAFSTAPWTLPSHASLFTGTYPSRHGADAEHTRLDGSLPTLAETFAAAGYETAGVSNNVWVTEEFGFTRGFDTFVENGERSGDLAGDGIRGTVSDALSTRRSGRAVLGAVERLLPDAEPPRDDGAARTTQWVRRWLRGRGREEPFFLFTNCIEPHLEYRPPREHAERFLPDGWSYEAAIELRQDPREYDVGRFDHSAAEWAALRALYRAEIAYLDERLGALVEALQDAGEWEDTVLLVTADHGENVGEHGLLGHQYCLYDTVLHVPLVVHGGAFSETSPAPTDDRLVQSVDVAPTLLDAAGIDAPAVRDGYQGRSLHPSADSEPRPWVIAEYAAPRPPVEVLEEKFGDVPERIYTYQRSLRAVRTDQYKYVRGSDGSERLYDLLTDPGETTDRAQERPGPTADLSETLDEWLDSFEHGASENAGSVSVEVEESTEQRLSDLGYL